MPGLAGQPQLTWGHEQGNGAVPPSRIHAEWIDAVVRQRPELNRARLERVAELMNSAVPDCLVLGFEPLEAGLTSLPDPNDRHVPAAAIHGGAQELVTVNLRDSPDP